MNSRDFGLMLDEIGAKVKLEYYLASGKPLPDDALDLAMGRYEFVSPLVKDGRASFTIETVIRCAFFAQAGSLRTYLNDPRSKNFDFSHDNYLILRTIASQSGLDESNVNDTCKQVLAVIGNDVPQEVLDAVFIKAVQKKYQDSAITLLKTTKADPSTGVNMAFVLSVQLKLRRLAEALIRRKEVRASDVMPFPGRQAFRVIMKRMNKELDPERKVVREKVVTMCKALKNTPIQEDAIKGIVEMALTADEDNIGPHTHHSRTWGDFIDFTLDHLE